MVRVKPFLFACAVALAPLYTPVALAETPPATPASEVVQAGPVNLNSASAAELAAKLHGIGERKAEAIVAHREANGPFSTIEQLLDVKGIGQATLDQNRSVIRLE